jgi:hypothetical protein
MVSQTLTAVSPKLPDNVNGGKCAISAKGCTLEAAQFWSSKTTNPSRKGELKRKSVKQRLKVGDRSFKKIRADDAMEVDKLIPKDCFSDTESFLIENRLVVFPADTTWALLY